MLPTTLVSRPTELDIGTYLVGTYFRAIKFDRMAYILKAHTRAFVFNLEIYIKKLARRRIQNGVILLK